MLVEWSLLSLLIVSAVTEFSSDEVNLYVNDDKSLKSAFIFLSSCYMSNDSQYNGTNKAPNNLTSFNLCNSTSYNSIKVMFTSGTIHMLTEHYIVSDLLNVRFTVNQFGIPSTISCGSDIDSTPGITFIGITNLTIEYLNIVGCGMKHISTSISKRKQFISFLSALYVQNSTNLLVRNVNISNSNGTGLAIIDTIGAVNIVDSVFRDNKVSKSNDILSGGGGVIIEFTECAPGILSCNSSNYQLANNTIVTVDNCVFDKNSALYNVSRNVGANLDDRSFIEFGVGGGLSFQFNGHATDIFISAVVTSSNFTRNDANNGGGLSIHGNYNTTHINVTIFGCTFYKNAASVFGGGGVLVGFVIFNAEESILHNTVVIDKCDFTNNEANGVGGGLSWHGGTELLGTSQTNHFAVTRSSFSRNKAQYGSAIQINKEYFDIIANGTFLNLLIDSCNFTLNIVISVATSARSGVGAVSASKVNLKFSGQCYFTENNSTALVGDDAELGFLNNSFTLFQHNIGFLGGAILLISSSKINAHYSSTLMFVSNTAVVNGGAIYVQYATIFDYLILFACFLRYPVNNDNYGHHAHFIFINNKAGENQTNSMFATTLYPCKNVYPEDFLDRNPFCFSSNFNLTSHGLLNYNNREDCLKNTIDHVSTAAVEFHDVSTEKLIPGKVYDLNASIIDELGNRVKDAQFVANCVDGCIDTCIDTNYSSSQSFAHKPHVLPTYRTTNGSIQLAGPPGSTCQLQLQTISDFQISGVWSLELSNCPPGYVQSNDVCKCLTDQEFENPAILGCEQANFQAYFNPLYWIGYASNNTNDLIYGPCPYRYCYDEFRELNKNLLPSSANKTELDNFVCGGSYRTGHLCGGCVDGYSVTLNSPTFTCEKCDEEYKLGFLFLFLSYILPVSILFYVIMTFNIKITTGLLGSFVFFSQLISSEYHYILIYSLNANRPAVLQIFNVLLGIYSVSNLDFFNYDIFKYCIFKSAGTIDIVAFELLISLYPMLLIAFYALFQRYCYLLQRLRCFKRFNFANKSITHGISAFLVLCFAKVNLQAFTILIPAKTSYLETDDSYEKVVYLQGDQEYFKGLHILYTLGSILFIIIVIVIPILILLVHPLIMKIVVYFEWGETRPILLINKWLMIHKLKPVIDCFQGNYEDDLQFFAGLQIFFYRTVFFILVVATTPNINESLLYISGYFIAIILIQSLAIPLKSRKDNALYVMIYSVMLAILLIEQYTINSQNEPHIALVVFQIVLCLIPLCFIVVYLVWRLINAAKKHIKNLETKKSSQVIFIDLIFIQLVCKLLTSQHKKSYYLKKLFSKALK